MINKYLEKELKENKSKHQIFERQLNEDLKNIKKELSNLSDITDIVIEFDGDKMINNKLLYTFYYDSLENNCIWEQYVALEIIKVIDNKFNLGINLETEESIIYESSKDDYLNNSSYFFSRSDVVKIIDRINAPTRLHFIINNYYSECLCDELSHYLQENIPFITMIYQDDIFYTEESKDKDNNLKPLSDLYSYEIFKGLNEKIDSKTLSKNKQKVLV